MTFAFRILGALEPWEYSIALMRWPRGIFRHLGVGPQIRIDGQTASGNEDRRRDKGPVHMVRSLACHFAPVIDQLAEAVEATRSQRLVGNQLQRCLDVTFGQDPCRMRARNPAENFDVVGHVALDLIRACTGDRSSFPRRRRLCSDHPDCREALLANVVRP